MSHAPRRTNTRKSVGSATVRHIAAQIKRMSDADVYAMTLAGDRTTRRIATEIAHKRAEAYAMAADDVT